MSIPEKYGSALEYYTEKEIQKYHRNNYIRKIQQKMTLKCIDLLKMKSGNILDVGCGSGHSLKVIEEYSRENELENNIVGVDINENMLKLCKQDTNATLLCCDISTCLPFYTGIFDYIISVSCVQWLLYASDKQKIENRIKNFFTSLYSILNRNGTACFQVYFESKWQINLLIQISRKVGFYGDIVTDGEGRNRKFYLILSLKYKKCNFKLDDLDCVRKKSKKRKKEDNLKENKRENSDDSDSSSVIDENYHRKKRNKQSFEKKRSRK